jgi:hypothetical protein
MNYARFGSESILRIAAMRNNAQDNQKPSSEPNQKSRLRINVNQKIFQANAQLDS